MSLLNCFLICALCIDYELFGQVRTVSNLLYVVCSIAITHAAAIGGHVSSKRIVVENFIGCSFIIT